MISTINWLSVIFDANGLPYSLKVLSDKIGISASRVSRLFFKFTGVPYRDFCLRIKILRSLPYLLLNSYSLEMVAFEAGFANASNYTRAFKRIFGLTPNDMRRNNKGKFGLFLKTLLLSAINSGKIMNLPDLSK